MRYALLIALRELLENAKTKGFWIGILMFPFIIGVSIAVSVLLANATPTRHFVVVDQSRRLGPVLDVAFERMYQASVLEALNKYAQENVRRQGAAAPDLSRIPSAQFASAAQAGGSSETLDRFIESGGARTFLSRLGPVLRKEAAEFVEPRRKFVLVDLPDGIDPGADLDGIAAQLRPFLTGERKLDVDGTMVPLFAAVLIPANAMDEVVRPGALAAGATGREGIQYWSTNLTDRDLPAAIARAVNEEIRNREYVELGISTDAVRRIQRTEIAFNSLDPGKAAGEEIVSIADTVRQYAPLAFVYLLWVAIFTIMQMLLGNTIEEKSNRIIEVLLSSVTPGELMMGKLMGIAAVGLSIVGTWILTLAVGIQVFQASASAQMIGPILQEVSSSGLLLTFLVYFVFGYLLYAGIFLSIGSLCNTLKEAQNLQGPMMLVMMVPLFTMIFITRDPNGTLATVLTWIPLYTPFVMMNRAAASPPLFDLVGSMILMAVSTALILWLSGRIFRLGILRTGQPPKLLEFVKWMRAEAGA